MAKLIEVIEATRNIGLGKDHDPIRTITEYYDKEGNLLARNDPFVPRHDRATGKSELKEYAEIQEIQKLKS